MKNEDLIKDVPICKILGVNIAAINMAWLMQFIRKNINKLSGKYICVSNVHTTVMAYEDENYRNVQNSAILAIPDGGPLSSVGRKRGFHEMQRTTGPDFMEEVFKNSEKNGYKHFFYGSTEETLKKMKEIIKEKYPKLEIVGMYSPPFRTLTEEEDSEIIKKINDANPDFVWVGLGAPKQEIWMFNHLNKIEGLMVGVGAAFDFMTGKIKRSPKWIQKLNLEWLYRLLQEPRRLFKRYWHTNTRFIWNAIIKGK